MLLICKKELNGVDKWENLITCSIDHWWFYILRWMKWTMNIDGRERKIQKLSSLPPEILPRSSKCSQRYFYLCSHYIFDTENETIVCFFLAQIVKCKGVPLFDDYTSVWTNDGHFWYSDDWDNNCRKWNWCFPVLNEWIEDIMMWDISFKHAEPMMLVEYNIQLSISVFIPFLPYHWRWQIF